MTGPIALPRDCEDIARLHEVIRKLYLVVTLAPQLQSSDPSLEMLCRTAPMDAALIARFDADGGELDDYRMHGLSAAFGHAYQRTRGENPVLSIARSIPAGHTRRIISAPSSIENDALSTFHVRVLPHHGIEDQLNFAYRDAATNALYVLQAYRYYGSPPFTETESWLACHCLPHLVSANAQAVILESALVTNPVVCQPTALCDARGRFFFAQEHFVELLSNQFSDWDGYRLPFCLPCMSDVVEFTIGNLNIHITPHGDLSIVRIWRRPVRDQLTKREQEIAELVALQLPTKSIAKRLNISPSTVGNHLQNAYKKLGVNNRAELAALMD